MATDVGRGRRLSGRRHPVWGHRKAREQTCRSGLSSCLGPGRPALLAPENRPSSLRNLRGEAEVGMERGSLPPVQTTNLLSWCLGRGAALGPVVPSSPGELPPSCPVPGSQARRPAQGPHRLWRSVRTRAPSLRFSSELLPGSALGRALCCPLDLQRKVIVLTSSLNSCLKPPLEAMLTLQSLQLSSLPQPFYFSFKD